MYSNIFKEAVEFVLSNEGGYVNNPNDKGGETNFGISKRSFPNMDIKNLTKEQAIDIYYDHYWKKCFEQLPTKLAIKIFDMIVNMGEPRAAILFQRAINDCGCKVSVDGKIGQQTIGAANSIQLARLMNTLRGKCREFYLDIIKRNPEMIVFEKGWLARADR